MGFVRGLGFGLIIYGFLNLFVRMGSDHIVARKGGLLGTLTGVGLCLTILMMILGCVSRILFCSGGRKLTEVVNSVRYSLIPVVIPIEVMIGYCYCSWVFHNVEGLKGMRYSREMVISIITALCQYMVPVVALVFEIPGTFVRRSNTHIATFLLFGGLVYFYCCKNPELADLYSSCNLFNRLGIYGRVLSYSKVIIVPIVTYELMIRAIQHKKIATPPPEKIKRS